MISSGLCQQIVSSYLNELQEEFEVSDSRAGCYIVTPFTRPDGEYIEVEVTTEPDGQIRITDMGDTLGYLYVNGLRLSRNTLDNTRDICKQFDVSLVRSELVTTPHTERDFGEIFHGFLQAILSVTNIIQKRRPNPRIQFDDEVESLIIYSGVTYDVGYPVRGMRASHTVKFHVNSARNILIQPIAASTESTAFSWAERWAYRISDIRQHQNGSDWRFVAVLDDRSQRREIWNNRTLAPIQEYAILWEERERLSDLLKPNQDEPTLSIF